MVDGVYRIEGREGLMVGWSWLYMHMSAVSATVDEWMWIHSAYLAVVGPTVFAAAPLVDANRGCMCVCERYGVSI